MSGGTRAKSPAGAALRRISNPVSPPGGRSATSISAIRASGGDTRQRRAFRAQPRQESCHLAPLGFDFHARFGVAHETGDIEFARQIQHKRAEPDPLYRAANSNLFPYTAAHFTGSALR
jgi:hypothetical protein